MSEPQRGALVPCHVEHEYAIRTTEWYSGANHLVLDGPLSFGRLERDVGDALCKVRSRFRDLQPGSSAWWSPECWSARAGASGPGRCRAGDGGTFGPRSPSTAIAATRFSTHTSRALVFWTGFARLRRGTLEALSGSCHLAFSVPSSSGRAPKCRTPRMGISSSPSRSARNPTLLEIQVSRICASCGAVTMPLAGRPACSLHARPPSGPAAPPPGPGRYRFATARKAAARSASAKWSWVTLVSSRYRSQPRARGVAAGARRPRRCPHGSTRRHGASGSASLVLLVAGHPPQSLPAAPGLERTGRRPLTSSDGGGRSG